MDAKKSVEAGCQASGVVVFVVSPRAEKNPGANTKGPPSGLLRDCRGLMGI